ncbi:synaptonemal complex protein 1-like [Sitophilus oryzae]|uniref:Synaptonemal complex protein 1-like n=1 Tax=Sitophilus oryzae TaxID=7048 RepID=A0A6J2YSU4_SITOR|nr:synaptonemal complex protein 1-like [Sitophilus oryzae]
MVVRVIFLDLKRKNSEYWTKLTEALRVVDTALNEKDAALQREQEIREEIKNLIKKNNETLEEYEARKEKEILLVTNEYEKKHRILLEDLNRIQNEAKSKELEIEEYKRKCILLEQDIKRIENGDKNVSRILELERKMESTFQSLVNSEKQNIQLAAEKLTIKNDIEHMADLYETNIKAKNTEIESYKIKISRLQVELEDKREEVTKVAEKMSVLNQQLNNIETQLGSQRKNSEILNETYTKKIEDLSQAYQLKINDLQAQMENKNEMRDKWKRETNIIVSNLEKLVGNLKDQIQTLKKENKSIKEKCTKLTNKINNYKKFIELISNDVSKLNTAVLEKYDLS